MVSRLLVALELFQITYVFFSRPVLTLVMEWGEDRARSRLFHHSIGPKHVSLLPH